MKVDLIVSRYNENIDWLKNISVDRVYLYNKGETCHTNEIKLPNIGREAHTYVYHLLNNYHNLSDYNIFCQGDPMGHGGLNTLRLINEIKTTDQKINFKWLVEDSGLFVSNFFGKPHHHTTLYMKRFFERVGLNVIDDGDFNFGPGAQFVVSKELIMRHPQSFYETLLGQFNVDLYDDEYKHDDIHDIHPRSFDQFYNLACLYERIWEKIFISNLK